MADQRLVVIRVVGDETKARIEAGFLESNGIDARIAEDDAGDQIPSLESTQGVRILVPAEQADRARKLLEEKETAD